MLKRQLQETQAELAKRAGDISLKEILAEKEEQIAGLLQEGKTPSPFFSNSKHIIYSCGSIKILYVFLSY